MTLSIKNLYKLVYALVFLPFLARFMTDNLGISYAFMPIFDIFAFLILVLAYYLKANKKKNVYILEFWYALFLLVGIISIYVNKDNSISNIFYSVRPYLRMVTAMLASAMVLDLKSMENLYKYIEMLLYINVFVMTFQYIFMGLRQDIIGGTFGNTQGCNGIQNILCVFVFCVTLVMFLNKKYSKKRLIVNTIVVLYIAIIAEINVLIFELVIVSIVILSFSGITLKKIQKRKLFVIVGGVAGIIAAIYLFIRMNPDRLFLFSFKNILEYLGFDEGNTGVYRISRLKVFSQLGQKFFRDDKLKWLFGYGIGNCSTHSDFYNIYHGLQYTYFSSSNVFLETGISGVIVNLGVLLTSLFLAFKQKKQVGEINQKIWIEITIAMIIIMIMMFFYNTTLRDTYTAFLCGVIVIVPYIISKQ